VSEGERRRRGRARVPSRHKIHSHILHAVKLAAWKDADLARNASDFRIHSEAETSPHRMEFSIQASDAVATDYK